MSRAGALQDLERFRALVAAKLGLAFDDTRLAVLEGCFQRGVALAGGTSEPFLRQLASGRDGEEPLRRLARELTVTETYFHRSAEQIRAFVQLLVSRPAGSEPAPRSLRVLSAGCASGEEPFSLAMAVRESHPRGAPAVHISAVDANPAMLDKARRGRYTEWSLRELPEEQRARWFRAEEGGFALDEGLRRSVVFEERNLASENEDLWRPHSWDAVFCRNVIMYFDPDCARALVARIAGSLASGGYLFLGHAETLRGLSGDFHLCHTHGTFYYRRKEGAPRAPETAPLACAARAGPLRLDDATWMETVARATERIGALADASRSQAPARSRAPARAAPDFSQTLELLRNERYGQALAQLDTLPEEHAREPEALLLRAVSAAHGGVLAEAERACRELLSLDELNAGARYVLALCREAGGDLDGALEEDRVALYLDPTFAMARLHLGLLARRGGERARARRELALAASALQQEDSSRLLLFGGGFGRQALVALCRAELAKCEARP